MSTSRHQDEPGASGSDAGMPPLSLVKLVHPGVTLLELVARGTPLAPVIGVGLVRKGLA